MQELRTWMDGWGHRRDGRKRRRAKMKMGIRNSITSFSLPLPLSSPKRCWSWTCGPCLARPLRRQMQKNVGYETRYFPPAKMPSRSRAHRPREISVCFHRKMDIFQCQPALRDDIIDLGDMRQPLPSPGTAYLSLPRMREIQGAAVVLFFLVGGVAKCCFLSNKCVR